MVRDLAGDDQFAAAVDDRLKRRAMIDRLIAIRSARGLSQKDIAEKLGCTQSRVSKLESGSDDDTKAGDLDAYAQALGLELFVGLQRKGATIADQVKMHTFAIRKLLHQLAEMSAGDESMVSGLRDFSVEVLFNTAISVHEANRKLKQMTKKLKLPEAPAPVLTVDPEEEDCADDTSELVAANEQLATAS